MKPSSRPNSNREIDDEYTEPERFRRPYVSPSGMTSCSEERVPDRQRSIFAGATSEGAPARLDSKNGRIGGVERPDVSPRVRDVIAAPDGTLLLTRNGPDVALTRLGPETPR